MTSRPCASVFVALCCFAIAVPSFIFAQQGPAQDIQALIDQLSDPEYLVRVDAARALGQMGPAAEPAVPALIDALHNGEIQMIINTPVGKESLHDDSYIRKAAIKYRIPYVTTTAAALSAADGIAAARASDAGVKSLQEYHAKVEAIGD